MPTATLLIVSGPNRGNRFEISSSEEVIIGRSVGVKVRLDDTEVSRQHAKIRYVGSEFIVQDLRSANGTILNGSPITERRLRNGDTMRLGGTLMTFQLISSGPSQNPGGGQVRFVNDSPSGTNSAIVQKVDVEHPATIATSGARQSELELLYQVAEELVTPVHTQDSLLEKILDLTLHALQADRGCVLLRDPVGNDLSPVAFCRRDSGPGTDGAQMPVSRSITDFVIRSGKAVRYSTGKNDQPFEQGHSIATSGIREAICAPMTGRSDLVGVFYIDTTSRNDLTSAGPTRERLTEEHVRTVVIVARQAALAIESRQFQDALVRAERFAAMGQTIAVLSHHIKNILQGVRGGSYLIRTGLDQKKDEMIRQGWGIVERNQSRIYDLVMDMLSYSKDRVPALQTADLNRVMQEVAELGAAMGRECGVAFEFRPGESLPEASFDVEGIHRAVLNIVSNAIDAASSGESPAVVLKTGYDKAADVMLVAVSDNGPGIPEDQRASIFNVFESSKGNRGTGIGLPVSRKILREHGGRIRIEGGPGEGTRFVLSWPRGNPGGAEASLESPTRAD